MQLGLFPLPNFVLLPGMVVPLYVFEPRYRDLLKRVQKHKEPFGIVRIKTEVNSYHPEQRISRVGTLAHLSEVEQHPDGSASIVITGGERFEIESFDPVSHTYLTAKVHPKPLLPSNEESVRLLASLAWGGFVRAVAPELVELMHQNAPHDPLALASFMISNLKLPSLEAQHMLEANTLEERLEMLLNHVPVAERSFN